LDISGNFQNFPDIGKQQRKREEKETLGERRDRSGIEEREREREIGEEKRGIGDRGSKREREGSRIEERERETG
jgi:hypothetical protein